MPDLPPAPLPDPDEELLQRLREMAAERDPLPEGLKAALVGLVTTSRDCSRPRPADA